MPPAEDAGARILAGLDAEQQAAVVAPPGPVRVLAGAGTGKTRTLTHRIAYLAATGQVDPRTVLAVTHSARAAAELRERLSALGVTGVQARTFHAAALRQLSYFWAATGLPGNKPELVHGTRAGRYGMLREALATALRVHPSKVESTDVLDLDGEITWARARRTNPAAYPKAAHDAGRSRSLSAVQLGAAYEAYELAKRDQQLVDFDDVISFTAQLLEKNPDVASRVRGMYQHFVVDEYQDTDPAQQRLLDAWLGERDSVTVVGDAQQAIYAFKGGEPSLIDDFTSRYPQAVSVSLVRDYRSTPQVVAAANEVLAKAPGPRVVLEGQRPDGPAPVVRSHDTEQAEERAIARRVAALIADGTDPGEIAVLHRFNSQAVSIEAALRTAGVPLDRSGRDLFFERKEILAALRALAGRAQRDPDMHGTAALAESLRSTGFDSRTPPPGEGAARERWDAQAALLELARTLPPAATETAQTLLDELARRARDEHEPRRGGVTVCTVHKAKGLEWDVVLLARLTEGSLPSVFAETPSELAEERRLFYVALTRARHTLELHHASARAEGGRKQKRSRFIGEALPQPTRPAPRTTSPNARRYKVRDRVTHDSYGLGWVKEVNGSRLEIDFGSTGVRTVTADSRKLELL